MEPQEQEIINKSLSDNIGSTDTNKKTDYALKRLDLWLNFAKFVLGTVVVGIVTAILNHQIQNKTLQIKEKEQEQEYVKSFVLLALDDNLEKRVRFARYFSALLKDNWKDYYSDVKQEYDQSLIQFNQKEQEYRALLESSQKENALLIANLQEELNLLKKNLTSNKLTNLTSSKLTNLKQFITLSAPAGGESLHAGQNFSIQWNAPGVQRVQIQLSWDNGDSYSIVNFPDFVDASKGTYDWTVPQNNPYLLTNTCKIKIIDYDGSGIYNVSQRFSIEK